ncbi:MAG: DUF2809 domain-containing protein [Salinibacter sp.]
MKLAFRLRLALSILVLVPLGIGTKFYVGPGAQWVQGHAGGLLYVVFWTTVVAVIVPTVSPWRAACGVFIVTCILELIQLWSPPVLQSVRQTFFGHALLGSTFEWWDFLHYGLGAIGGAVLVGELARQPRTSTSENLP